MAANRIDMMKIREILLLKQQGVSNRACARKLSLDRNTVNDYVTGLKATNQSYEWLSQQSDVFLAELFACKDELLSARYEALSSRFPYFYKELRKVGCTRQALWKEYLKEEPDGYRYTQFNEHYNRWLERKKGSGKLIHIAGEKLFVDFTGKRLHYVDPRTGEVIEVQVFVGILPSSKYTFVQAVASQKRADFIECVTNCLEYYGGSPQSIVPDNLKSAVTKASKYAAVLNKTFSDFGLHYSSVINPARPRAPQDKALVESAVRLIYQRIFYPLNKVVFHSLGELNRQLAILLEKYNNDYQLSHLGISRRQLFLEVEKATLQPLPQQRYELKEYKRATVQKMGFIFLSAFKNYYSVPYRLIGKKVEVRYNQREVEIYYAKERVAFHQRSGKAGHYTLVKGHLSSQHQFYKDWSPAFFHKWALKIGPSCGRYIKALLAKSPYPETAYKQCLGIIQLAKTYGNQRVNGACERGHHWNRYGYHFIKNMLKNKADLLMKNQIEESNIPSHSNIRGADYYE